EAPVVICESCGGKSCYIHKVIWHTGKTCGEYEKDKKQSDSATEDYIQRNTKRCPKCSISIEKSRGCDHMTYVYMNTPIINPIVAMS
ncbi:9905_t:CDS:2, partial [Diversispora eburnea]